MRHILYRALARRYRRRDDGMTRREMLQRTLAAAAGLLVSARCGRLPPSGRRVIIVGAGFAGLACAHELASAGYDVVVIEARNRVGGRVLSFADFVPGRTMEGGGEFIGANHPTWHAYKDRFSLDFLEIVEEEGHAPIAMNGRALDAGAAEALWHEMDAALSLMNAQAERVDAYTPWRSPAARELDVQTTASWIAGLPVSDLCRSAIDAMLTANNGVPTAWQSHLGNLAMVKGGGVEAYWSDTEVYRCRGGNAGLALALAGAIGADRIRLATPVTSIVAARDAMTVTTAGGERLEADEVVLATPPSVWSRIAFEPALPGVLRPQMGSNVKFLMAVGDRFWQRAGLAADSFGDGPVHSTWEGTNNQPGPEAGLVAFSGGQAAEECRAWPAASRVDNYLAALELRYPGIGESLVDTRFMDWPGDGLTGASYSFPAPGQIVSLGPMLDRGLGRLHFAGEHTCYAFVGYMEGALMSGVRLATRLAERDGILARSDLVI